VTDPTPLDPAKLAAIRSRDDEGTLDYGSGWGSAAVADRRALLTEVDRLAEALAVAERERDEAGQSSLNRLAQNIDLRTALTAERAKVARLTSALRRTEANFRSVVAGHPVRDMGENLAENAAALAEGAVDQPGLDPANVIACPAPDWRTASPDHAIEHVRCDR